MRVALHWMDSTHDNPLIRRDGCNKPVWQENLRVGVHIISDSHSKVDIGMSAKSQIAKCQERDNLKCEMYFALIVVRL